VAAKEALALGPHMPAGYELADVSAVQALQEGTATADQQKRALRWMIERAAATYEAHFYPDERLTVFALGRAFVGQQLVKMLRLNVSTLRKVEDGRR
jgi:hypothetical protein